MECNLNRIVDHGSRIPDNASIQHKACRHSMCHAMKTILNLSIIATLFEDQCNMIFFFMRRGVCFSIDIIARDVFFFSTFYMYKV